MRTVAMPLRPFVLAALALPAAGQLPADLVVPGGETLLLDPAEARWFRSIHVEAGGTLRVLGDVPLAIRVADFVRVDGALVVDGLDATPVTLLDAADQPKLGAPGNAGSGAGGDGSPETTAASAAGGNGRTDGGLTARGGRGGESSYSMSASDVTRVGAGGGGGRLVQDLPDQGFFAAAGLPGAPTATGAVSGLAPAAGGAPGGGALGGSIADDFFGLGVDPRTGRMVVGELTAPIAGQGGGAGGDSIRTASFPQIPFVLSDSDRGGAGGSGGGLALIATGLFVVGPEGRVSLDGGDGATGEGSVPTLPLAGAGGGGSGGMLIVQADLFDLSRATDDALTALGGRGGGPFEFDPSLAGGGDGGPGLLQLHPRLDPALAILLPAGRTLADLTAPDAHVLLPFPGL